jgi:hypothetical protein
MLFAVVPVCVWGRPLSRRDVANQASIAGDIRVEYLMDAVRQRHRRVARIVDARAPTRRELLPMLYDAELVAMSPSVFTLTGFERIDAAEYAQSWLVAPIGIR